MRIAILVLVVTASCGGEARKTEASDGAAPASAPSQNGSTGSSLPGNQVSLPDCKPGFDPEKDTLKSCDFVVESLCYESKLAACACACPAGRASTSCTSGFPVPNGRVPVTCK